MRDLADEMRKAIAGPGDHDAFADLLHQGWELKKSLGFGISIRQVDEWYEAARRNGATGGKLLGAGGGGFMIFVVDPERREAVRERLKGLIHVNFDIDTEGSKIVLYQPNGL
jgi:D-glycero-alpha-D-manno-heptose-7-phosphate kinase